MSWAIRHHLRRRLRLAARLGVVLIAIGTAAGATAYILMGLPPAWFKSARTDIRQVEQDAAAFENILLAEASKVRPVDAQSGPAQRSATWWMRIGPEGANAWLATRLRPWLESSPDGFDWPSDVHGVQVAFSGEGILVGAEVHDSTGGVSGRSAEASRIVSVALQARVDAHGALWLEASRVWIGRMPVPASWAVGDGGLVLGKGLGGEEGAPPEPIIGSKKAASALKALDGSAAALMAAKFRLPDGRHVRIVDIRSESNTLLVGFVTE